jgi:DNA-binding NtrC family response regulator/tetratricopeptide (TPR) repeat protein
VTPGEPFYDAQQALLADTLQLTGDNDSAERLANSLINRKTFDLSAMSRCHIVLGTIARERRNLVSCVEHFKQAVKVANAGLDSELACWAKLRLMLAVAEQQSTEAAIGMLPDVRASVTRLGDAGAIATLHLCLAKLEGTRGLLSNARRHIGIARSLLLKQPNAWIEGNADLDDACIAFLASDVNSAFFFAMNALRATDDSGHAATRRAACANLGHVHLTRGEFETAERHFREALSLCQPGGGSEIAILDGLAQLELAQGRFNACEDSLKTIEQLEGTSGTHVTYYKSWAFRTRLHLLTKLGRTDDAIELIASLRSSWKEFPPALRVGLMLLDAELRIAIGDTDAAQGAISAADTAYDGLSIEVLADIERVLGNILRSSSQADAAASHTERAIRIFSTVGNIAARDVLVTEHPDLRVESQELYPQRILERFKSFFELAEYPEPFGYEIASLLKEMNCTTRLNFVVQQGSAAQLVTLVGEYRDQEATPGTEECVTIGLGSTRNDEYFVTFTPSRDLQSQLQCAAITKVVNAVLELRRLRADVNERRAIWPSEEPVVSRDAVFAAPSMVEILRTIRKIAASTIPVLLTGETGTGKEVVAKTVHDNSSRASRPFIPFNCAAVPRDLVESQLFGHRRGAFSGAHDHFDGIIRAAKGGTLFLDEIGEMSLEVQPKLLRFLESGEIHPLGEAKPIQVDVRVVAASNANLEQLVSQGQFREDLFYRLNVIRLAIPSLRERREEIPLLVKHFLERHTLEHHKTRLTIAEDTMEYLLLYGWPGNIRQLSNEIKRFVALAEDGAILMPEHLSSDIGRSRKTLPSSLRPTADKEIVVRLDQPLSAAVQHVERAMLLHALKGSNGRVDAAAKTLGLSRKGLYLKRQRLDLGLEK